MATVGLTITRGDTTRINFPVTVTPGGLPMNISGLDIRFIAKRSLAENEDDPGTPPVLRKSVGNGLTVLDASGGLLQALILPDETSSLQRTVTRLFYALKVFEGAEEQHTVADGELEIDAKAVSEIT